MKVHLAVMALILSQMFLVTAMAAPSLTFSDLTVEPLAVSAGTPVLVSVKVLNTGDSGTSEVALEVNGVVVQTKSVSLSAGVAITVGFEVGTNAYAGNIEVRVGSQTGDFTVLLQPLPSSSLVFGNFTVSPKEVGPGDPINGTLGVINTGGVSGLFSFQVILDGAIKSEKTGELLPGESAKVSFTLTSSEVGTHRVEAAGFSATFTVIKPFNIGEFALPLLLAAETIIIIGVAVILLRKRKMNKSSSLAR